MTRAAGLKERHAAGLHVATERRARESRQRGELFAREKFTRFVVGGGLRHRPVPGNDVIRAEIIAKQNAQQGPVLRSTGSMVANRRRSKESKCLEAFGGYFSGRYPVAVFPRNSG